jgi:tetratricopeptide (TPR) repeat protein
MHPATARSLHNVGQTLQTMGRLDEASANYERAYKIKLEVLGPDHPELGTTLVNRAVVASARGDFEAALALVDRVVVIWEGDRDSIVRPLADGGDLLRALGRPAEAAPRYQRCHELRTATGSKTQAYRRLAAVARLEAGEVDAALVELQAVVAAEAETFALGDPKRLRGLIALARAEVAAGKPRDARATLDKAAKLEVSAPEDAADLAMTKAEVGKALGRRFEVPAACGECDPVVTRMLERRAEALR